MKCRAKSHSKFTKRRETHSRSERIASSTKGTSQQNLEATSAAYHDRGLHHRKGRSAQRVFFTSIVPAAWISQLPKAEHKKVAWKLLQAVAMWCSSTHSFGVHWKETGLELSPAIIYFAFVISSHSCWWSIFIFLLLGHRPPQESRSISIITTHHHLHYQTITHTTTRSIIGRDL